MTSPKLVKTEPGMWLKSENVMAIAVTWALSSILPWNCVGMIVTLDVSWCVDDWLLKWQKVKPRKRSTCGVQSSGVLSDAAEFIAMRSSTKVTLKSKQNFNAL